MTNVSEASLPIARDYDDEATKALYHNDDGANVKKKEASVRSWE